MSEPIQAYPLQWPPGWRRTSAHLRTRAQFRRFGSSRGGDLSVMAAIERVLYELRRMDVARDDIVISSNLPTRLDGFPRGDARDPSDPGVAVYWRKGKATPCMAIDRYDRVADNLAAVAATLDAMRAIERHGGAAILERAFTGFLALPAPEQWFTILGVRSSATVDEIEHAYQRLASKHHPDRPGGNAGEMARINQARDRGLELRREGIEN